MCHTEKQERVFYNASQFYKGISREVPLSKKKKKADSALWVKALSLMVCIMNHLMWHMHPGASGSSSMVQQNMNHANLKKKKKSMIYFLFL